MANIKFTFLVLGLLALGLYVISQSGSQNLLGQSSTQVFSCPVSTEAYFDNPQYPFFNYNLTVSLLELSKCSGLKSLTSVSFDLKNSYIDSIFMFKNFFLQTPNLEYLSLDLQNNQITDPGTFDLGDILALLPKLKTLEIFLAGNQLLLAAGFRLAFQNNSQLETLILQFGGKSLLSLDGLVGSLSVLTNLDGFNLQVVGTEMTKFPTIDNKWEQLEKLTSFVVTFENNPFLKDLANLGKTLSKFTSIPLLSLNFINANISDTSSLWKATQNITQIAYLYLQFDDTNINLEGIQNAFLNAKSVLRATIQFSNSELNNLNQLWVFLNRFQVKQALKLDCQYNQITTLQGIENIFSKSSDIISLDLDFYRNSIVDVAPLGKSFSNLKQIQSFILDLSYNQINDSVIDLTQDLYYQIAGNLAYCPFTTYLNNNPFESNQYTMMSIDSYKSKMQVFQSNAICTGNRFTFTI